VTWTGRRVGVAAVVLCLVVPVAEAYQEAPILAERVVAGELPPVEERLPQNPVVVEPIHEIGRYGGTWNRLTLGIRDVQLDSRMGYDPIVRWDRTGMKVAPGLAESWEVRDGGRAYVFHLRKGLKWSDGRPLTSEDFLFYYEDVLLNEELCPAFPSWLTVADEPVEVRAPDPHTVEYRFAGPCGVFLEMLAYRGNIILMPKHYLRQFHARYADADALEQLVRDQDFDQWYQLFWRRASQNDNPDLPTWKPFKIVVPPPANRIVAKRNPYYWKVDPAGNQLPYIDRVVYADVQNNEVVTMKAMAGDVSFQARRVDPTNYPLFMENREQGGYRVLRDLGPDTLCLYVNQYSKDPVLRPILQDRRFRIALSLAVNRDEVIDILFTGMAVPSRGVASEHDPFYLPEFDEKYMDYDPVRANALLDAVGLSRGRGGIRRLPNGAPFRQSLHVYPTESGTSSDLWQLVADHFREVGLDFAIEVDAVYLSVMQIANGNSDFWAYQLPGMHWAVDPRWYVPWVSTSYYAPLYGRHVASDGRDKMGIQPPPEHQRLVDWYRALCATVDPDRKLELGRNILRQWADECYCIGICRQELLTIVSNRFKNVPDDIIHAWQIYTPGYIGIEQFYIEDGAGKPR